MCFAVGDSLADGGFEFEPILDAIADFLYEDAVAAEFVAGVKEFVPGRVVDVVAVNDEFEGVGCVCESQERQMRAYAVPWGKVAPRADRESCALGLC